MSHTGWCNRVGAAPLVGSTRVGVEGVCWVSVRCSRCGHGDSQLRWYLGQQLKALGAQLSAPALDLQCYSYDGETLGNLKRNLSFYFYIIANSSAVVRNKTESSSLFYTQFRSVFTSCNSVMWYPSHHIDIDIIYWSYSDCVSLLVLVWVHVHACMGI